MQDRLREQILKTIRRYDMIGPGDSVLVAVSGGPDSVYMLFALRDLARKLRIGKIFVCTLDHGLRGGESRADALFVRRLSASLGITCLHRSARLARRLKTDRSIEERAREARYAFYTDAARICGANVLATGHTLDDQAETVLMRVIKGSSLKGVAGVPPVRVEGTLRIVRPLIEIEKCAIEAALARANIGYRIDRSNAESAYFRNIVRRDIVPFLEKYNPRLKRSLFNLAEHLREDYAFITEALARAKRMHAAAGGGVEILLKDLVTQPRAIQKEIVRDAFSEAGGDVKKLSFRHWKEVEDLLFRKGRGSAVDLPGSIRLTRTPRAAELHRRPLKAT